MSDDYTKEFCTILKCLKSGDFDPILTLKDINLEVLFYNQQTISKFIRNCPDDIFKYLIGNCQDINVIDSYTGYSLLNYCCIYLNENKINSLLRHENLSADFSCKYFGYNLSDTKIIPVDNTVYALDFYNIYPIHILALYGSYDILFKILNITSDETLREKVRISYYNHEYKKCGPNFVDASIYDLLFYKKNITTDEYMNLINTICAKIGVAPSNFINKIRKFTGVDNYKFSPLFLDTKRERFFLE